jgi:hypothetical protein
VNRNAEFYPHPENRRFAFFVGFRFTQADLRRAGMLKAGKHLPVISKRPSLRYTRPAQVSLRFTRFT